MHHTSCNITQTYELAAEPGTLKSLAQSSYPIHASCLCRHSRQVTFSVSNIVRWQRRLDFLITHLTGKACSRLETTTHAILRLAVHELVFQKLPAHAISEHVNLAKALVRPAAGNLVNGKHSCKC